MKTSNRRPGFTLVEMLVVMVVMTLAMTILAAMFTQLFALNRQSAEFANVRNRWERLTLQFRQDAHAAQTAQVKDGVLQFELPDGRSVFYSAEQNAVRRREEVNEGTAEVAEVSPKHEAWKLTEHDRIAFSRVVDQDRTWAELTRSGRQRPGPSRPRRAVIRAAVGLLPSHLTSPTGATP